jgi:ketosteroid isomerase-like protein
LLLAGMNEGRMKVKHAFWVTLLLCPFAFCGCPTRQTKDEAALVQIEQSWAQALDRHDSETVSCFLADEFQEVDLHGMLRDRAENLASVTNRRPGRNQLSELHPHVYGDFGYVRGLNSVLDADGKVRVKVRFTDIFVYREGRWLAVAGQESLVSEK